MLLVEEASLTEAPEVDLFPVMGKTKSGARKARILRYAF